jgi:glycosyltransferase involved in cell wall biosynthesis
MNKIKVFLATNGAWYLPNTAAAFFQRETLSTIWTSELNRGRIPTGFYKTCWATLLPSYLAGKIRLPQILKEKLFYALFPVWKYWFQSQKTPEYNVIHGIMGFCTELFDHADRTGALKVVDCPNSHPTTYYGYWQRECDLWCHGERVPIPQWMFARMNRELERADVVLCPSLFVRDTMLMNGIPEEKCFVNPFGVNTDIFIKRTELPKKPKFVAVGTISVRKGFQYLFRAFEIVKKKLPDAELIVVSDYKTDFRNERPKWEGTFTHVPRITHAELAKLLQTCTAFVFPSQEEGFARVITEAMGAGLPVIATHESGATTLVEDGIEGFIVRGRDPHHIAEAMLRLAQNPELCSVMGEAAYEKGAIKNTWQDYGDRLLKKYSEVMDSRNNPAR